LQKEQESAEVAGNDKRVAQAKADIEARRSWLDEAKKALTEFSS
jgi:hypothetical protein